MFVTAKWKYIRSAGVWFILQTKTSGSNQIWFLIVCVWVMIVCVKLILLCSQDTLEFHKFLLSDGIVHNKPNIWRKDTWKLALVKFVEITTKGINSPLKTICPKPTHVEIDAEAQRIMMMFQEVAKRPRNAGTMARCPPFLRKLI